MLKVNEVFGPTIQGEGKSAGLKVLFLRLSTCNLHCSWCDTPYTWNWVGTKWSHPKKFDPKKEIEEMSIPRVITKLEDLMIDDKGFAENPALVISGGEPLIQQKQLQELVWWLKRRGWWIEIETNGTIAPLAELDKYVDQYNCSPKLSNSGDDRKSRVRSGALNALVNNSKVFFKFVIASTKDIEEVMEYVDTYNIPANRVYLMPLGMTREELELTREKTEKLAHQFGFNFSDRLHVVQFGGVRGV